MPLTPWGVKSLCRQFSSPIKILHKGMCFSLRGVVFRPGKCLVWIFWKKPSKKKKLPLTPPQSEFIFFGLTYRESQLKQRLSRTEKQKKSDKYKSNLYLNEILLTLKMPAPWRPGGVKKSTLLQIDILGTFWCHF
jgi:hypothetical protein